MAKESDDLLITLVITKPNESSPRKSSIGKVTSSSSRQKVLPHYLRASTGSCHDFCKYGRKHASEAKEIRPLRKRVTKSSPESQTPTVTMLVPKRKNISVDQQNPSLVFKSSFDILGAECTNSSGGQIVNASSACRRPLKSEVQSGMRNTSSAKLRNSPKSKSLSPESSKIKLQEVSSSSEKVNVSFRKVPSKSEDTKSSAKVATSLNLKSPSTKPFSVLDHSGGLGYINSGKNLGHPKVAVKKELTSPRLSLASPRASLSQPSKVAAKKALGSSRLSLASPAAPLSSKPFIDRVASINSRKHKSLKPVSVLKNQVKLEEAKTDFSKKELKQVSNDKVDEETLYAIKMGAANKSSKSYQNGSCGVESSPSPSSSIAKCFPTSPSSLLQNEDLEESEYTETDREGGSLSESEYEASMSLEGEESFVGEHQEPKKDGMVHSEHKDSQAKKLRIWRGKIARIQSDSDSPWRLKFRRGRVLGQNQNLKADGRRCFVERGADGEMNNNKPDSEKVVLRHQNMEGKKDSQVLLNNVIEQTASKLVETQKSKVKALVGAFETVISLQESKPSADIVS